MAWLAITRGGFGDVWLHDTRTAAYLHPLTQYGDALVGGPDDLARQYNRLEWPSLRVMAGLGESTVDTAHLTRREYQRIQDLQAPTLFDALVARASRPPSDPQQICDIVSRDRRTGTDMAKKKSDAPEAPTVVKTAVASEKTAGGLNLTRGPKGVPLDAVIHLMADTKGVQYGPDNNPKKPGSKTHGRFACYSHGMTIQQAIDAGIQTGDLTYDRDHGFVQFHGGSVAPASAPAPVEASEDDVEGSEEESHEEASEDEEVG